MNANSVNTRNSAKMLVPVNTLTSPETYRTVPVPGTDWCVSTAKFSERNSGARRTPQRW